MSENEIDRAFGLLDTYKEGRPRLHKSPDRGDFEAAMRKRWPAIRAFPRDPDTGAYLNPYLEHAWIGWQEARSHDIARRMRPQEAPRSDGQANLRPRESCG